MALKTTLQGKLDVTLTEDGLEARIEFTPGEESAEIDAAFLSRLLQMKNVREGISPKDLESVLAKLKGAKGAFSVCAARGTPPQEAAAEKAVWEKLAVPPELEENAQRVFAAAGEPAIFVEKTENIKHEKIVLKKSHIPFAPPRKEKIVEVEKKVTKQRVQVNPEIAGTGYVAEGALIAQLEPFTVGKPGKSVTGALLPAKILEAPYVYAGEGVLKKGGKLIAQKQGFVRRGINWAEVIGFRRHEWEVSLSPDRQTCLLSVKPGDLAAAAPTGEDIRKAAAALPYDEKLLLPAADIYLFVRELIAEGQPGQRPITLPSDAEAEIRVSGDKLEASLFLRKGRGSGKQLSLKELGKLIQSSGLVGLNLKKIQADIVAFHTSAEQTLENYVLAKGRAPTGPEAADIKWEVKLIEGKELEALKKSFPPPPAANAEAPAAGPWAGVASVLDFPAAAAEMAAFVSEGARVLSLKPGKPGVPGADVYGKPVPPQAGKSSNIVCRENVEQEQAAVKSRITGLLEARKSGGGIELRVRPHKDGELTVSVAPNAMEAFAGFFPAEGTGRAPAKADFTQAVTKSGVVYKAQNEEVLAALQKKIESGEAFTAVPFAKGKLPKDGTPPKLNILVQVKTEKVAIRGDGKADYKNRNDILSVKKDQTVAEILLPENAAEDGWDVTGKPLGAKAAGNAVIHVGKNVREEKADGKTLIIAEVNGELKFDETSISVTEGYVVDGNVDMKSGNIKFPGSVFVSGCVETGFVVMSGGDIKIGQGMGASLLSAEGSITLEQGVKGMGKAVLRAKKNISAVFAEQAVLLAVGDVAVKTGCVRCQIKCNGKLKLSSDKGVLLGGVVKARRGIEAASIGNEKGVQTEISFGQDYLLGDQIETLEKTIQKLNQASAGLNVRMREAQKSGDTKGLESCRAEKLKNIRQVEKLNHQLLTLREKFEEHYPGEITVRGTLYPGVVIESHGRYYEVKQPRTNMRLTFDQESGKIVEI